MRYSEILTVTEAVFGRGLQHLIMKRIEGNPDEAVRQHVADWFERLFVADDPAFPLKRFQNGTMGKAATRHGPPPITNKQVSALGKAISTIEDPHMREYIANWIGDSSVFANGAGGEKRWLHLCLTGELLPLVRAKSWQKFQAFYDPLRSPDGKLTWERNELPDWVTERNIWTIDNGPILRAGDRDKPHGMLVISRLPWNQGEFDGPGYHCWGWR